MTYPITVRVEEEHRFVQDALGVEDYRQAILERTRQRIAIFDGARRVWRFAESLKSISADTAQEYEDRAVLELIQNGHDALAAGGQGRIKVRLDPPAPNDSQADDATNQADEGVLYDANDGRPFAATNFEAITELALSDKAAGQGIGNKGLGFRSVLQLTDWPEIYSRSEATSAAFDGYCFRFATPADVKRLVEDEELADRVIASALSPSTKPTSSQSSANAGGENSPPTRTNGPGPPAQRSAFRSPRVPWLSPYDQPPTRSSMCPTKSHRSSRPWRSWPATRCWSPNRPQVRLWLRC